MRWIPLAVFCVLLTARLLPSAAPEPVSDYEKLLRANGVPTDSRGLLDFLRKQLDFPITEERIEQLIEQLGDDRFAKREEATRELILAGRVTKTKLLDALKHDDLEIRSRAARILRQINNDGLSVRVQVAAVRLLAYRNPEGTVSLLLKQAPLLKSEPIGPVMQEALSLVAVRKGKADPLLVAALADRNGARRYAAALALLRAEATDALPALVKLLADEQRDVRFDIALELTRWQRPEAIPILIQELGEPVTPRHGQAEELLCRLAGDKAPILTSGEAKTREEYRQAWLTWWKEYQAKVDLGVLKRPVQPLNRTLIVLLDEGQILSLNSDNKERWKFDRVPMVLDAQPLPGDRVLLAEYNSNRVTERTREGKIVWETRATEPLVAQRLGNGHTLIAAKESLSEIDRDGREVFSWTPQPGVTIMRARRLDNGDILLILQHGATVFTRLDIYGAEIVRFPVEVGTSGGRLDLTSKGNVLIPEMYSNRIAEYDAKGTVVRQVNLEQPISCVVLPSGNILATSYSQKRAVELDAKNKEVWEYKRDTKVTRAIRY